MSEVLGIAISNVQKTYHAICEEKNVEPQAYWKSLGGKKSFFYFKRYQWQDFSFYLESLTLHLETFGVDILQFQRRLIPKLFSKILAVRMVGEILSPSFLIKGIDVWGGSFLFKCADSKLIVDDGKVVGLQLDLLDRLKPSRTFFEHCFAGMKASLELCSYYSCFVDEKSISDSKLRVKYRWSFLENKPARILLNKSSVETECLKSIENLSSRVVTEQFWSEKPKGEFYEAINHIRSQLVLFGRKEIETTNLLTEVSSHVQLAFNSSKPIDKLKKEEIVRLLDRLYDLILNS